ncbi:MAG: hypothetical protein IPF47_06195 [Gemmatimonadetes bacterium]|nr:hypothetical protein [Gemmatimonadota bacterium]
MTTTVPELRWPPGASRSPWYPHARLFRRLHSGDWRRVASDVRNALRASLERTGARERFDEQIR